MKRQLLLLLFCILIFAGSLFSQNAWANLGNGLSITEDMIYGISVVDENIIWGVSYSESNPHPAEYGRTEDGGQTWITGSISTDSPFIPTQIHAINNQIAWVTATDFSSNASSRVYKTEDGGTNWIWQSTAFTGSSEVAMAVYFWDENEGFAFGGAPFENNEDQISVYTTEDGGENWEKVVEPNLPPQEIGEGILPNGGNGIFEVVEDHIWFVTLRNKIYHSNDRGKTWEVQTTGFNHPFGWASVAFKDTLNGMVVNWDPEKGARTTDGGENWVPFDLPSPSPFPEAAQLEYIPGTDSTYIYHDALWAVMNSSSWLAISHDFGESWAAIQMNFDPVCIEFLSDSVGFAGGEVFSPTEGGFLKWNRDNLSVNTYEIHIDPIHVSPNPVDDVLFIQLPGYQPGQIYTVNIYDMNGRQLLTRTAQDTAAPFDLSGIPSGTYVIKVFAEEKEWIGKVIKR